MWYIEIAESERRRYEDVVLGASGRKWSEFYYCPECQKKILINQAIICERCGTKVCHDYIKKKGFILNRYTPQLCCGWDRPMQQRDIVKQCFGIQITPKLQSASAIMPRSSAAVGCAGATFDF